MLALGVLRNFWLSEWDLDTGTKMWDLESPGLEIVIGDTPPPPPPRPPHRFQTPLKGYLALLQRYGSFGNKFA